MKWSAVQGVMAVVALSLICAAPVSAANTLLFTPPSGWSSISGDSLMSGMLSVWQVPLPFTADQFKMVGMWTGAEPMQMLTLTQGRAVASPATIAHDFPPRDVTRGQVQYRVATQPYSFCGFPGTLVNVQLGGLMGFTMAYDLAVTQAGGVSYMLSYIHMAGAVDPAAERSLRSLCPRDEIPRTQSRVTGRTQKGVAWSERALDRGGAKYLFAVQVE